MLDEKFREMNSLLQAIFNFGATKCQFFCFFAGSSVGSFDSEFRHDYSIYPSKISYDPSKTGSLDSRTQEVNEKTIPVHSRSSSDIICQTVSRYIL